MTATEMLRRLLDERGVEYTVIPEDMYGSREYIKIGNTEIRTNGLGEIAVFFLTPEQAIEATLGRGECRRVLYKPTGVLVCSECGAGIPKQLDKYCYLRYCPNCGRKVVDA